MVKSIVLAAIILGLIVAAAFTGAYVIRERSRNARADAQLKVRALERSTPADLRIQAAQAAVEQSPDRVDGYHLLCSAYMQKARETGDFAFNLRARAALDRAFELEPDDYDALKLRAKLLLTYHQFNDALTVAQRAQNMRPDDHDVYGALTDAMVELGDYRRAVEAAQKMMDLRPDTASYARVSYLRALHGDSEGAIGAMVVAAKAADPNDPESIAWCYVQLGDELMNAGKRAIAERIFDKALGAFPEYHLALAAKGRARVAAGDLERAITFYQRAERRVPLPDTAAALGDIYTRLGRRDDARREYNLVEFIERAGAAAGTYSRQLALFYADHDEKLDQALEIARRERASRSDIFTCDALAWCLFKTGQLEEARVAVDEALCLGTRDARIHYHAGMIYGALGDRRSAARHLKLALEINPSFDVLQAEAAKRALETA